MKFAYTILYVDDVTRSVEFYEKAFGLDRRFIHESGQYAEMRTGETTLSFTSNELAATGLSQGFQKNDPSNLPAGLEIAFTTEDVKTAFTQALQFGAIAVAEPVPKPWGQVVAYVRDLDGVLVEIATPM